jgi:hypothetical protein
LIRIRARLCSRAVRRADINRLLAAVRPQALKRVFTSIIINGTAEGRALIRSSKTEPESPQMHYAVPYSQNPVERKVPRKMARAFALAM